MTPFPEVDRLRTIEDLLIKFEKFPKSHLPSVIAHVEALLEDETTTGENKIVAKMVLDGVRCIYAGGDFRDFGEVPYARERRCNGRHSQTPPTPDGFAKPELARPRSAQHRQEGAGRSRGKRRHRPECRRRMTHGSRPARA